MNAFEIPWVEPEVAFRLLADERHLAFLDRFPSGGDRLVGLGLDVILHR
jgi:hypothetical protein